MRILTATRVFALIASVSCMFAASSQAQTVHAKRIVVERMDQGAKVQIGATVRGKGPLVVLVPSLGRGAFDFSDLAKRLARAGYQTAAIDPRSVGDSKGGLEKLTIANFEEDVLAVSTHLSSKPAVYIGHAFGNRVPRAIDLHHPERVGALILMAGGGGQTQPSADGHDLLDDVFDDKLTPEAHMAAVKAGFFAPGNSAAAWRDGWYPALYRAQMAALAATPVSFWLGDGGKSPVLIIQASDDYMAPPQTYEFRAKAYPTRSLEVKTIANAGHALLPEQPDAVAETVLVFLKRAFPPRRLR